MFSQQGDPSFWPCDWASFFMIGYEMGYRKETSKYGNQLDDFDSSQLSRFG